MYTFSNGVNQNNKKIPIIPISIIVVAVLALGYFLFKSSPQNLNNQTAGDGMHEGANDATLNSWVGKPMPNVQLADKDGKIYTEGSFKGKNTVLFFNEGIMCYPACWNQVAAFGTDQRFNTDQVQAMSVVIDSPGEWQKAFTQMPDLAKATILFDANAASSRQLGLLSLASSMHKGSMPGHTYIVLDKQGIVRFVYDDPNMAMANDMLMNKIAELK